MTIHTSVEEINGRLCTVVKKPVSNADVLGLIDLQSDVRLTCDEWLADKPDYSRPMTEFGRREWEEPDEGDNQWYTITRLPALPRHPTFDAPDDDVENVARIIAAYRVHGIIVWYDAKKFQPHAIDSNTGERVEVAIAEKNTVKCEHRKNEY